MIGTRTPVELDALQAQLERRIRSLGSVVIAFSGGVDSSLVAALGARALGERALAVTAVSAALATGELDGARAVARSIPVAHECPKCGYTWSGAAGPKPEAPPAEEAAA